MDIGDILRLVKHDKYYNVGYKNDLAIILSVDKEPNGDKDLWKVGVFWWSSGEKCGGARVQDFYIETLEDVFEVIGNIKHKLWVE